MWSAFENLQSSIIVVSITNYHALTLSKSDMYQNHILYILFMLINTISFFTLLNIIFICAGIIALNKRFNLNCTGCFPSNYTHFLISVIANNKVLSRKCQEWISLVAVYLESIPPFQNKLFLLINYFIHSLTFFLLHEIQQCRIIFV